MAQLLLCQVDGSAHLLNFVRNYEMLELQMNVKLGLLPLLNCKKKKQQTTSNQPPLPPTKIHPSDKDLLFISLKTNMFLSVFAISWYFFSENCFFYFCSAVVSVISDLFPCSFFKLNRCDILGMLLHSLLLFCCLLLPCL